MGFVHDQQRLQGAFSLLAVGSPLLDRKKVAIHAEKTLG
jgi:hypothetical protein